MKKVVGFSAIILFVLTSVLYTGCSKDIKINADWRDVTVVFGLLNQQDSVHYIKINKAFLGETNAYDMAKVRDSSEYDNLTAVVEQWKKGSLVQSYPLSETEITTKDSGVFYYPEQKVYTFMEKNLDKESSYKLIATIDEDKIVTAETEIIDGMFLQLQNMKSIGISFAGNGLVSDPSFDIMTGKDAKRFEVYINFNYTEISQFGPSPADTNQRKKTVQLRAGEYLAKTTDGGESVNVVLSGEDFYRKIGDNVPKIEGTDVVKRVVEDLDIFVVVGGDELNTYLEVTKPSSGLVQDKKQYTNVTNGIGLFSSRYYTTESVKLTKSTITELMGGLITSESSGLDEGYTVGRGFCNNYLPINDPESCWYQ